MNNEEVIKEISNSLKKINKWATLLQTLTISIALTAIITSSITGFFVGQIDDNLIKVMAVLTTFCTLSISTLNLEKKAYNMREAYRYLKNATFKYKTGEYDINALVAAYDETEKLIGHVEINEDAMSKLKIKNINS